LAEYRPLKPKVEGSIPSAPAISSKKVVKDLMSKNFEISFKEHSTGLNQAFVNSVSIPLLFEENLKEKIISTMNSLKFEENITLDFFKQIVSGCIKTHMRQLTIC
jgi:hypothetical protein